MSTLLPSPPPSTTNSLRSPSLPAGTMWTTSLTVSFKLQGRREMVTGAQVVRGGGRCKGSARWWLATAKFAALSR
jgi:hypothetical protein